MPDHAPGHDATPLARLKVAQLALKVETQRLTRDETKVQLLNVGERVMTSDLLKGWPQRAGDDVLEKNGFPSQIANLFCDTATTAGTIILSRTPGKAATRLISERYDVKGYYLKAKSCNWGPMAGFICENPYFNKAGKSGAASNADYINKYLTSILVPPFLSSEEKMRLRMEYAFVPLELSKARRDEIASGDFEAGTMFCNRTELDGLAGVAMSPDECVLMEFVIRKKAVAGEGAHPIEEIERFEVLAGRLFVARDSNETLAPSWDDPNRSTQQQASTNRYMSKEEIDLISDSYAALWDKASSNTISKIQKMNYIQLSKSRKIPVWPINGIKNRNPPYGVLENYKNAVTGDYDLFSVWPIFPRPEGSTLLKDVTTSSGIISALKRPTEARTLNLAVTPTSPFAPVDIKFRSLSPKTRTNVLIEVVPNAAEMGSNAAPEDPDVGNINEVIETVAQTLNSAVGHVYAKGQRTDPNVAYHSDEGGRPNVKTIEYPIALFIPEQLIPKLGIFNNTVGVKDAQKYLISDNTQFLTVVSTLAEYAIVPIHIGWVAHLVRAASSADAPEGLAEKLIKLIYPPEAETGALADLNRALSDPNLDGNGADLQSLLLRL